MPKPEPIAGGHIQPPAGNIVCPICQQETTFEARDIVATLDYMLLHSLPVTHSGRCSQCGQIFNITLTLKIYA